MFDDRDRRPPEEQPRQQPKPAAPPQREFEREPGAGVEKSQDDRIPPTDPDQN